MKTNDPHLIEETLRAELSRALGSSAPPPGAFDRFRDLGLDSVRAVALTARLAAELERALPPTLLWEHPTIAALTAHLSAPRIDSPVHRPHDAPAASDEPIAVIGMSCRVPGAASTSDYWRLLRDGIDAVTEVPASRWSLDEHYDPDPAAAGKMSTKWGGFLQDIDRFDAAFFGISPREAAHVDPLQRLTLELAWEAFEDGGADAETLRDAAVGVFVGAMGSDFARLFGADPLLVAQHTATGLDTSIISARISYALGLQGPSLTVNTACSSSLVAVHLACQSLRSGESAVALAGGINLILSPQSTVAMSKFGGMAPDGRCKAFDARANGYVRSEGGGMVLLKRLSRALADGDAIRCVIRGSAVNNDGFSNGLTAPNPRAQEAMLREAYARAAVDPRSVAYVEAHGTGTKLGDPIEAGALGAVLGAGRAPDTPLRIGSVKTNVGHLEAAAGIAGLIKVALALEHGELPPSLNFRSPNPEIAFDELGLRVQTERTPWPANAARIAGVSSFGFGGTNCHVIVEGFVRGAECVLPLAAVDEESLQRRIDAVLARIASAKPVMSLREFCASYAREIAGDATVRRAFIASTYEELARELLPPRAPLSASRPSIAFVFPGAGAYVRGMGRRLMAEEPFFRDALDPSVREALAVADECSHGDAQILAFELQAALAALWRWWGIAPDLVVGHSSGEIAAATAAGVLDPSDGARLIRSRMRLVSELVGGGMAVIGATPETVAQWIDGSELQIAGRNAEDATLVSGDVAAIDRLVAQVRERGAFASRIAIAFASHSPAVEPLRERFLEELAFLRPRAAETAYLSAVDARILRGAEIDAAYWYRNLREPVRFHEALQTIEDGTLFLEISAKPVFAKQLGQRRECLSPLSEAGDGRGALLRALARLFEYGAPVRWDRVYGFDAAPADDTHLLVLSARSEDALEQRARDIVERCKRDDVAAADLCWTAAAHRAHHRLRLAVTGNDAREFAERIERGEVSRGIAADTPPRVAAIFPGQGNQWIGMGRDLMRSEPLFLRTLERCDTALATYVDWSLLEELHRPEATSRLRTTPLIQPALFAMQCALADLWKSWGVVPEAVIGHSMGEAAAAYVAGMLSLDDAARVIATRSRIVSQKAGPGAMAMVELAAADALELLRGLEDRLVIGVVNSPRACVLSGDPDALADVLARLQHRGVFCRRLEVDYASHCPQIQSLEPFLLEAMDGITSRPASTAFYSTTDDRFFDTEALDAAYWVRNLCKPVQFASAIDAVRARGIDVFLEMSPHPSLLAAVEDCLRHRGSAGRVLPSMHRQRDARAVMLSSLGALYTLGARPAWSALTPQGAKRVALPAYPWQRERHWPEFSSRPVALSLGGASTSLLGNALASAVEAGVHYWHSAIGVASFPHLADHRVHDRAVFPAAAYVSMAADAAEQRFGRGETIELAQLAFERPLLPGTEESLLVQTSAVQRNDDSFELAFASRTDESWTTHATGSIRRISASAAWFDVRAAQARCMETIDSAELYAGFAARGLDYGDAYRTIVEMRRGGTEAVARLEVRGSAEVSLFDGALQLLVALRASAEETLVPARIERCIVRAHVQGACWAYANADGDVFLIDDEGRVLVEAHAVQLRPLVRLDDAQLYLQRRWSAHKPVTRPVEGSWLLVGDESGFADRLAAALPNSQLVRELERVPQDCAGIIYLAALDAHDWNGRDDLARATRCDGFLRVVQRVVAAELRRPPRLVIVTRGVERVRDDDDQPASVWQAPLWGFGRTVAYEHPELRCTRIDLAAREHAGEVERLVALLWDSQADDELAIRSNGVFRARLARGLDAPERRAFVIDRDATYLVTGGLGFVGLAAAGWLIERGARHLLLASRSRREVPELDAWRTTGVSVHTVAVDVADRDAVAAMIGAIAPEHPLRGVIHAAGILDDGVIVRQDAKRFHTVLAPKAAGAWHLHRLTAQQPLDFFVLVSSALALLGSAGQSSYIAANAFLDTLARHRAALGLPATSIAFGPIAGGGLAAENRTRGERLALRGMRGLAIDTVVSRMEALVSTGATECAVVDLDVRQWVDVHPQMAGSAYLSELKSAVPRKHSRARRSGQDVESVVRELLASVLRLRIEQLDARTPMADLGLDSLMGLELRNRLESELGVRLPVSLFWAHPDVGSLTSAVDSAFRELKPRKAAKSATTSVGIGENDPIAIVGMACRFPGGADDPQSFWRLLVEGRSAIEEIPDARWGNAPKPRGRGARFAGLLRDVERFDAQFFGIAPREAAAMDPQQRLLLEVAWEALEHGGQHPGRLQGSACGVFVGMMANDYRELLAAAGESARDAYSITGNGHPFAAGRLSYALGLNGPSLAVDTACSSSLVAVHLACRSLQQRESDVALACGANLILSPAYMSLLTSLNTLAPDGRCKVFDARANGYVRGEGVAVLVLTRLSDALRNGDRVWAVIRGSAVNQDGRSAGLTAPSKGAQESVIRRALEVAGLTPDDVGCVEAHGTGTPLGDPIEADALRAVFGGRTTAMRCALGSVKANVGHLEGAAGMAGLIKSILMLNENVVPPQIEFQSLNPRISLDGTPFFIASQNTAWNGDAPRIAGVSGFGLSGTNAHVVLEEPPRTEARAAAADAEVLIPLTARHPAALRELAAAHRMTSAPLADLAHTLGERREHHRHRLAIVARTREQFDEALDAFCDGGVSASAGAGEAPLAMPKIAFVFPGQGSQWLGMGREMYAAGGAFRVAIDACDEAVRAEGGWSVTEELFADEETSRLDRIDVVQPLLFSLQVALAAQWRAWGVTPDVVVGHSMGEVAAAVVAGALELRDGVAVICRRSALMAKIRGTGAMALVELGFDDAAARCEGADLSIAALNGPRSSVIAGAAAAVDTVLAQLTAEGIFCRRMKVDVASHSPHVDAVRDDLHGALRDLKPRPGSIPICSSVDATLVDGSGFDAEYWQRNLRQPVRFADAIGRIVESERWLFIDIGPHPTLAADVKEILAHRGLPPLCLPSLRRDRPSLRVSAAEAFVHGAALEWKAVNPPGRCIVLPRYPWQRERFWIDAAPAGAATPAGGHPLLGRRFHVASQPQTRFWHAAASAAYLGDHRVEESQVFPAAASIELALAAMNEPAGEIAALTFAAPLFLPSGNEIEVAIRHARFTVSTVGDGQSTLHVEGSLIPRVEVPLELVRDLAAIRARCGTAVAPAVLYGQLDAVGMHYGPAFCAIAELWRGEGEALARVALPPELEADASAYGIHPVLLDGCFQTLAALVPMDGPWVPRAIEKLRWNMRTDGPLWCHARVRPRRGDARGVTGDLSILDLDGREVAAVSGLLLHPLHEASADDDAFLQRVWEPAPERKLANACGAWLLLADGGGMAESLATMLRAHGGEVVIAGERDELAPLLRRSFRNACQGIVVLSSLDGDALRSCHRVTELVRIVGGMPWRDAPRLVLVTRGAQAVSRASDVVAPEQATLWGLGRVIAVEHAALACTRIDLPALPVADEMERLLAEIVASDDREDEVAIRDGGCWRGRLVTRAPRSSERPFVAEDGEFRLRIAHAGSFDALEARAVRARAPLAGEVQVAVDVCGLNFRDVLKTLGALPPHAVGRAASAIGYECSGRVVAIGEGVTSLRVGDEVLAVSADGTASSTVTVAETLVLPKPQAFSSAEAATIPIAFLTAHHALDRVARLEQGERVLIHAAAGGVGLAAVQWALHAGAIVFATAGSVAKRDALHELGVEHVSDSRSLAFVEDVRRWTNGEGVDVVLNSLTGDLREASLALLRDGGRFVELGVRSEGDAPLALTGNRSYATVDLLGMLERDPSRLRASLEHVLALFERGVFRPLPCEVQPAGDAERVMRALADGRVIGRVALSMCAAGARPLCAVEESPAIRPDASYLITGGTGALGQAVARWLAANGARHLILLSRGTTDEVELPADVTIAHADVSRADELRDAVHDALRGRPPLRGVFHAAGVIDDAMIEQQTWPHFEGVAAPKIAGAWNLHELTRALDLDFFVLCSSVAALLGTPGQANYAAANAFMDALAFHRRAAGLPATSINWGPLAGAGIAVKTNASARLADRGLTSMALEDAAAMFGRLLLGSPAQIGVARLDVRQWLEFHPQLASSTLLASLIANAKRPARAETGKETWASLAPRERLTSISDVIVREAARVLRLDVARLDHETPLANQGLDSLTGLELRNRLERAFGLRLSASLLWRYPQVAGLAAHFDQLLGLADKGAVA